MARSRAEKAQPDERTRSVGKPPIATTRTPSAKPTPASRPAGPPVAGTPRSTLPAGAAKIPRSLVDVSAGTYGTPGQTPAVIQGPPEAPLDPETAVVTLGMPLRYNRAYSLFIDDPLFTELRGPRADRTMQRMLADAIIAGTI